MKRKIEDGGYLEEESTLEKRFKNVLYEKLLKKVGLKLI